MVGGRQSLLWRAILAIVLMIGFYLFAIAIAFGLFYAASVQLEDENHAQIRLVLICVIGGLTILWSVLPRVDTFLPPGPRLLREKHPRLFCELDSVAAAVKQTLPSEVYLVPDVNAWVSSRGGIMGFGSRPVMGLGLPLLQVLTVSELRAVLAHEFGHFQGGDTRLTPWIWKTRSAIIRTLTNLSEGSIFSLQLLQLPFLWYGKLFLRITHAVSRQQEYAADALAATIAGSPAMINGLQKIHGAASVYEAFWQCEVNPILAAGFRPPLAAGFGSFMQGPDVSRWIAEQDADNKRKPRSNPYDTHPPLQERIAALGNTTKCSPPANEPSALELLDGIDGLEKEMVASICGSNSNGELRDIRWQDSITDVYLPIWGREAEKHARLLSGIRMIDLPGRLGASGELVSRFEMCLPTSMSSQQQLQAVGGIIGCTIVVLLHQKGWSVTRDIGQPVEVGNGDVRLKPFALIEDLFEGKMPADEWKKLCIETCIADVDLGELAPPVPEGLEMPDAGGEQNGDKDQSVQDAAPVIIWVEAKKGRPWTCPRCREINQPRYDVCYNCGDLVQKRIVD